jgi:hypothetical protein
LAETDQSVGAQARAGLRTIRTGGIRWPQSYPDCRAETASDLVDPLTRSGEGRLGETPEDVERPRCASLNMATLKSDYNAARSWPNKINRTDLVIRGKVTIC